MVGVVDKNAATGDLLVREHFLPQPATPDISTENLPFPQIIFAPRLFISAAVLRASEGLA